MKFQIMHESSGRMRIRCCQNRMTLEQADLLEAYLQHITGVRQAVVHERTCCAVIYYQDTRSDLLQQISRFSYDADASIEDKLAAIVKKVYHGDGVVLTPAAKKQVKQLTELGFGGLPVCVAKTQYSLSDDPTKLGAPQDFILTVRKVKVSAGAGFIVALTGDILTMPGLPKTPAAEAIDVDENGVISGLF